MRALIPAAAAALLGSACPGPAPTTLACKDVPAGSVVITELMPDPASTDTGKEWVELHNPTGKDVSLSGMTLFLGAADGTKEKTHVLPKTLVLPAGAYMALGDVRNGSTLPPWIGYSYADALGAMPNSAGAVGVRCGTTVLDKVTWADAPKSGHSLSLDGKLVPDATNNDNAANFCAGAASYDTDQYGTPGKKNDACEEADGGIVAGNCFDSALNLARPAALPTEPGDLVISEFMPNPAAVTDTAGEWFELYATKDVDLNGLTLTAGSSSDTVEADGCLHVAAGSYAVIAKNADGGVNGGLPVVTATTSLTLANSNSSLSVANGGVVIDTVTWASAASGAASQLDPLKLDAAQNDAADAFCPATQAYGAGDKGTPGSANTACSGAPAADTCVDATTGQPRPIVRPVVGDVVITELLQSTAGSDTNEEWFEVLVKQEVDLNGLKLGFDANASATLQATACIHPGANTWLVFAHKADPAVNGGLPAVTGTFGFSLTNTGPHAVKVSLPDGGLLDQVTYDSAQVKKGVAWQLDFNNLDPLANDAVTNFCFTDAGTYGPDGGNAGTPGAFNGRCF